MGGHSFEGEWAPACYDLDANSAQDRTIVLVGKMCNGKSSTGNSIIGRDTFKSEMSLFGVTKTCEMQARIESNRNVNVIDTPDFPGLFEREIVKCIDMAEGGIHAFVVVFSVRTRFSQDDVIERLRKLFGNKISDYMIVVFTSGDDHLGEISLEDYLRGCPEPLKKILRMCGNRCLLFDNKTECSVKKSDQLNRLLAFVDVVVHNNGGKPYTDELFAEVKKQKYLTGDGEIDSLAGSSIQNVSEINEQLKKITEKVDYKRTVISWRLEEQVANECAARVKAEVEAKEAQKKCNDEIRILKDKLERDEKEDAEQIKEQIQRDNFEKLKREQIRMAKLKRAEKEAENSCAIM